MFKKITPSPQPVLYNCLDCEQSFEGFDAAAHHIIEELHRTVEAGVML